MQLLDPQLSQPEPESHVVLHNISWERYEALLTILGDDQPGLRLNYLKGELEIWMPGREHEKLKRMIARLLEIYALETDIDLYSCGSATFRKAAAQRGLEPDESYCIGSDKDYPDLAIEIVMRQVAAGANTTRLLDRLEIYKGLGIPEIWIWKNGQLTIQQLNSEGTEYRSTERSQFFPDLDLAHLTHFINPVAEPPMIRAFRDSLHRS